MASSPVTPPPCPACGGKTKSVEPATVRALVRVGVLDEHGPADGFRFCATEVCPVVYTQADSGAPITTRDLTVEVFQKSDRPERPVCYCFGYSMQNVQDDARSGPPPVIIEDIEAKCRQGLDRCEVENPEGRCCLGNVRAIARAAGATAASPAAEPERHGCCAAEKS